MSSDPFSLRLYSGAAHDQSRCQARSLSVYLLRNRVAKLDKQNHMQGRSISILDIYLLPNLQFQTPQCHPRKNAALCTTQSFLLGKDPVGQVKYTNTAPSSQLFIVPLLNTGLMTLPLLLSRLCNRRRRLHNCLRHRRLGHRQRRCLPLTHRRLWLSLGLS